MPRHARREWRQQALDRAPQMIDVRLDAAVQYFLPAVILRKFRDKRTNTAHVYAHCNTSCANMHAWQIASALDKQNRRPFENTP
jgi:hypothetical protein